MQKSDPPLTGKIRIFRLDGVILELKNMWYTKNEIKYAVSKQSDSVKLHILNLINCNDDSRDYKLVKRGQNLILADKRVSQYGIN